jgi:hypothetical protein
MLVISATEFVTQNLWAYKTIPNNPSPNINSDLLLMSGLSLYYMGLHHTKYACYGNLVFIPCKACFVSDEYTVAKKGIFIKLSKEPLVQFLVWGKNQVDLELVPISNGIGTVNCSG